MYLPCASEADPDIRTTTQNLSRRPRSASRARSCLLSFDVKGWKDGACEDSNKFYFIETTRLHGDS